MTSFKSFGPNEAKEKFAGPGVLSEGMLWYFINPFQCHIQMFFGHTFFLKLVCEWFLVTIKVSSIVKAEGLRIFNIQCLWESMLLFNSFSETYLCLLKKSWSTISEIFLEYHIVAFTWSVHKKEDKRTFWTYFFGVSYVPFSVLHL